MKNMLLFYLLLGCFLCLSTSAYGFVVAPSTTDAIEIPELSLDKVEKSTSQKLPWHQRLLQKWLKKKLRKSRKVKQKGQGPKEKSKSKLISTMSAIMGIGSVLGLLISLASMLFLTGGNGFILVFSALFGASGLIMGIVGLNKEDAKGLAITGISTSSVIFAIVLLSIMVSLFFI